MSNTSPWHMTTIGKSSYLRGRIGWQGLRAAEFKEDGPFLITGTDFIGGRINWDSCYHVSEERYAEAKYIHVRDYDVLVTKDGTIGKIALANDCPKKAVLNSGIFLLRCKDSSYLHPYIYHILQSYVFRKFLDDNLAGSTIQHLYQYVFEKFEFPIPELLEQTKIAEILSTVDRAIEQTEALIAKQQRVKTGLMQDLLTRGIDEHGNLRSEQTHQFKDSPLGRIPVEWEVASLNSRASVKGGKRLPIGHVYDEGDTKYRYLQTTDFISKALVYSTLHYLSAKTFRVLERYEITAGEVFISIAGVNLGVAGVFRPTFDDRTILTENAARIHILKDTVPEYLAMQLNGPTVQRQILEDKGIGAGVPKLALFRIQQFIILWPSQEEQLQIVRQFQFFNVSVQKHKEKLKKMRSLRTALMQDLLTGKKRVTPLLADTMVTN